MHNKRDGGTKKPDTFYFILVKANKNDERENFTPTACDVGHTTVNKKARQLGCTIAA